MIGDVDLVRTLGLAGVGCALVAPPGDPARYSRHTRVALDWVDPWDRAESLVDALVSFAATQPDKPVLFYQSDAGSLVVSRFRERLREAFRFVIPDGELVENLVDKSRFQTLSFELGLPTPRGELLSPQRGSEPAEVDLRFPLVIKPLIRRAEQWAPISGEAKAMPVETREDLGRVWPKLVEFGRPVLAQEAIPGPESQVECYHAYIDADGTLVSEFTGRKVRTYPPVHGYSTALVITRSPDVADLGRRVVQTMEFRGVLNCDFKRGPSGDLSLLEINPRFTFWHHLAAEAGVNVPALVYDDLVGLPRGRVAHARLGTQWCLHLHDARAARASGVPLRKWLPWAARCEAKSAAAWGDPLPFLRGVVLGALIRRITALWRSFSRSQPARSPH